MQRDKPDYYKRLFSCEMLDNILRNVSARFREGVVTGAKKMKFVCVILDKTAVSFSAALNVIRFSRCAPCEIDDSLQ